MKIKIYRENRTEEEVADRFGLTTSQARTLAAVLCGIVMTMKSSRQQDKIRYGFNGRQYELTIKEL